MRIGLASDSFGNVDALARALDLFARQAVDRVFFLGGRWADVPQAMARRQAPAQAAAPKDDPFLEAVRGALAREAGKAADPLEGKIVRVASRACPEAHSGAALRQIELVAGQLCCLVHDKADLGRDDIENAVLLFHGNSARAGLVAIGPRVFITPGHLRRPAPEGRPASFAVLEVGPQELELVVYDEAAAEVRRERAPFGARGKMTVR